MHTRADRDERPALDEVLREPARWPVGRWGLLAMHGDHPSFAGDLRGRFRWASISKLVLAVGVHLAVKDGRIDLDEQWGPPAATVRDLLAHTSGLSLEGRDPAGPPLRRRRYSNAGYDLLGELLARRSGTTLGSVLQTTVFDPLGMVSTRLVGRACSGLVGSTRDLGKLAAELARPVLVDLDDHAAMTRVTCPGLAGVLPGFGPQADNTWGMGPEVRGAKDPHWCAPSSSPRTFGHFGQAGGFVWVDPDADVWCCFLGDLRFGPWAVNRWPAFSERVLHAVVPAAATVVTQATNSHKVGSSL